MQLIDFACGGLKRVCPTRSVDGPPPTKDGLDLDKDGWVGPSEENTYRRMNPSRSTRLSNCKDKCDKKMINECLKKLPKNMNDWPKPPRKGTERDTKDFLRKVINYCC